MTATIRPQWTPPAPLTPAERRTSLINAARIRYRHPYPALVLVRLDAPRIPADQRWEWLDRLGALVDRQRLLALVADSDGARDVLQQLGEGPWTDEVLCEALTRRDETSAEIDDMVRESQ